MIVVVIVMLTIVVITAVVVVAAGGCVGVEVAAVTVGVDGVLKFLRCGAEIGLHL